MQEALRARGWALHFVHAEIGTEFFTEMMEGDPGYASSLFLWPLDSPAATTLDNFLSNHDYPGLLDAYENSLYGSCTLWPSRYDFNEDHAEDELQELTEYRGEAEIDAMRQARTHYTIRNGGLMTDADLAAQGVLWLAIGELTGGFLEDDQEDLTLFSHEITDAHYSRFLAQFQQFQKPHKLNREQHADYSRPPVKPASPAVSRTAGDPSLIIICAAVFAGLMTILGLQMIARGLNPLSADGWYLFVMLAHAPVATGLLLRLRWALPAGMLLCLLMAGLQIYLLLTTGYGLLHFSAFIWIAFYLFAFSRLAAESMLNAFFRR